MSRVVQGIFIRYARKAAYDKLLCMSKRTFPSQGVLLGHTQNTFFGRGKKKLFDTVFGSIVQLFIFEKIGQLSYRIVG